MLRWLMNKYGLFQNSYNWHIYKDLGTCHASVQVIYVFQTLNQIRSKTCYKVNTGFIAGCYSWVSSLRWLDKEFVKHYMPLNISYLLRIKRL